MLWLSVRPDESVPVGGMTVSALETLIQAFVCDRLSAAVTHRQVSASNFLSEFGATPILIGGSMAENASEGRGSGCHPQTPRAPACCKRKKT